MRRDIVIVAVLWLTLTAIGEALVFPQDFFPSLASVEGRVVDDAFRLLTVMAVPVFMFVVAMLLYSVLRFRKAGVPVEDGPPLRGSPAIVAVWFLLTTGLIVPVIIHPGVTGVLELAEHASEPPDLVVEATGSRWYWDVAYPEYGVTLKDEMVLPEGAHVRFNVSATDVIHSFWVPAFRVKIDAVPGMITTTYATPNKLGAFDSDVNFRLQCAELCGTGHALMDVPIRVVDEDTFKAWIAERQAVARATQAQ